MRISKEIAGQRIRLKVAGRFDVETHHLFRSAYRALLAKLPADAPQKALVIDMAEVDYMDSSALGMLLLLRQDAEAQGVAVSIERCSPTIAGILRVAHFDRLFAIGS